MKLFYKTYKFSSFIVYMPDLSSNISSSIFNGSIFSEFLRTARCILRLEDFVATSSQLYTRMVTQGVNKASILRQIEKALQSAFWDVLRTSTGRFSTTKL